MVEQETLNLLVRGSSPRPFTTFSIPLASRFAPTPSGPLHRGSFVAALASYLFVRSSPSSSKGRWYLRMDDLDGPRNAPGAIDTIQRQLEMFGLDWDGPVSLQSEHVAEYQDAFDFLKSKGFVFACQCSRLDLERHGAVRNRWGERVHQGVCSKPPALEKSSQGAGDRVSGQVSMRCWLGHPAMGGERTSQFEDLCCGTQSCAVVEEWGSPVLCRADGIFSYQLANVVDDLRMGITHVIRGADLLGVSHVHRELSFALAASYGPTYGHVRVLKDSAGRKLSKSEGARAIGLSHSQSDIEREVSKIYRETLGFLGFVDLPEQSLKAREWLEFAINICRGIHVQSETSTGPRWFVWRNEEPDHPSAKRG